ncbi:MAG: glutamate--tRNA ligase [Wolbachia endosymbiont of Menacanthus eurysternus]|nr:MAG: glutamate--tRNA ligase [Wolbachia endosymbiont of Menacanthus eurysternus]
MSSNAVVTTRFAPSPTGPLHIGGARTALFNWLYAKHYCGKFLLRIEDTDKKRSTQKAINAIIKGLKWLGINHDGEIIYQSKRIKRHIEIINLLIEKGKAYYCYCHKDMVLIEKIKARENRKIYKHKCTTTNINSTTALDIKPVVRFKTPDSQNITVNDRIYGKIKTNSEQFDDMIILRSDRTPIHIFATVVDDHDDKITDIIRGSDHLTNTFKQLLIYQALGFNIPRFAHIPLIHGEDGNKLSKRNNVTNICDYENIGILPQAIRNYLLRLGWSHGNNEIIKDEQAIKWFNLKNIGRSPARLDFKKLRHLNNYYINNMSNIDILRLILLKNNSLKDILTEKKKNYLLQGLTELKKRANYLTELLNLAQFYIKDPPFYLNEKAKQIIKSNLNIIRLLILSLSDINDKNWNKNFLLSQLKKFTILNNIKISDTYESLRAPITGTMDAPGIIDIIVILGKDECIKRLQEAIHLK